MRIGNGPEGGHDVTDARHRWPSRSPKTMRGCPSRQTSNGPRTRNSSIGPVVISSRPDRDRTRRSWSHAHHLPNRRDRPPRTRHRRLGRCAGHRTRRRPLRPRRPDTARRSTSQSQTRTAEHARSSLMIAPWWPRRRRATTAARDGAAQPSHAERDHAHAPALAIQSSDRDRRRNCPSRGATRFPWPLLCARSATARRGTDHVSFATASRQSRPCARDANKPLLSK
jgi:hypothetical protein